MIHLNIKKTFFCVSGVNLADAGETLVIVGCPAGTMRVVLVLKEAGMGVFF